MMYRFLLISILVSLAAAVSNVEAARNNVAAVSNLRGMSNAGPQGDADAHRRLFSWDFANLFCTF